AAGELRCQNGILISGVAVAIDLTKRLGIGIAPGRHANLERHPALSREQRCDGPTTQYSAENTTLALEIRRLIEDAQVIHELDVIRLRTIGCVQVPWIDYRHRAAALVDGSRSHSTAPSEVRA